MTKIEIRKKKRGLIGKREVLVAFAALILSTAGIEASDMLLAKWRDETRKKGDCPSGMVRIPYSKGDFCIDAYELSPDDACVFPDPTDAKESRRNIDDPACKPVSRAGALPWRNITRDLAERACAKAGKRLPTAAEWQQAALGTPDHGAPWGTDDCQVRNNWDQQPGLCGSGAACESYYGAFDMVGNVWEWVTETADDGIIAGKTLPEQGYIAQMDGQGLPTETDQDEPQEEYYSDYFWLKDNGVRGILRGGYWNNGEEAGVYSLYAVVPPDSAEPGIGFRCVR